MKVKKIATAGTFESGDINITIGPNEDNGIDIDFESSVEKQFGTQILKVIKMTLKKNEIQNARIKIIDNGAIDYVIVSRLEAAIHRATEKDYNWGI